MSIEQVELRVLASIRKNDHGNADYPVWERLEAEIEQVVKKPEYEQIRPWTT